MRETTLLKPYFFLILIAIFFTSCKSTSGTTSKSSANLAQKIINTASENLGVPYKYAGTTKSGFDCSGLVFSTFNQYDIKLPRSSAEQSKVGIDLGKNISKAQKGDLIFFKTNNRNQINHVGIVTNAKDDELEFIHSSTSRGVIISSTKESYYDKTFAQLNRILP
ncbi:MULTISPECIES: C40 family peptidase [Flavobacterium]|uniref:Glycoside hydrolase n=1 Tax=Flavobacterium commune TaxID=1306519 RepID=A0A1D9P814_9FLAO|nr:MULTISPECIES: C40 family peptidase [Flavobacterium]AOZ98721.1 glycoside hydrolase [Flavobacterium commune]